MNLLNRILNSGINTEEMDKDFESKIRLSNVIAVVFLFIGISYVFVAYVFAPEIIIHLILALVAIALVPFLNMYKFYNLSRLNTVITTSIVSFVIHIGMLTVHQLPLTGNFMLQMVFLILPWLLFDLKEKLLLYSSFLISALCIALVIPLNYLIEPKEFNVIFNDPILLNINIGFSIAMLMIFMYLMKNTNRKSILENENLISMFNKQLQANKESEQKLNEYIKQIEITQIEDKKREWASAGLAKFSEILRENNQTTQDTYYKIVSNLVKYIEANQGALFIVNDESSEIYLEMVSCYAYDRKKHIEKKILIGEGLLGQCYLEKDIIYLTEVPNNYTLITSGLGDATPSNLIIVPLIVNEIIYGVIEIASFAIIEDYKIEFLKKIGEGIASAIGSLKTAEKTQELLRKTMEQTEEMRAQEEEMRQNMEEMSATHEEMDRLLKDVNQKERYLHDIINVSKDSIATVDHNYNMLTFNKQFESSLIALGLKPEKGLSMLVFAKNNAEKDELKNRFDRVFKGESFDVETNYEIAGKLLFFVFSYMPIYDIYDNVYAAAVYSKNVTELVNAKNRAEALLADAQLQAEQMKAQEEEMISALEDMTQSQEKMREKESEVFSIIESSKANEIRFKEQSIYHIDKNEFLLAKIDVLKAILNGYKDKLKIIDSNKFIKYREYQTTGRNIRTFVDAIDIDFKSMISQLLEENDILYPYDKDWYSLENYLKVIYCIECAFGANVLNVIGKAMLKDAILPPSLNTIEDFLDSMNLVFHMDHAHNEKAMFDITTGMYNDEWTIGGHKWSKDADGTLKLIAHTPYPDALEKGVVCILARKFEPLINVYIDETVEQRDLGGKSTTYILKI